MNCMKCGRETEDDQAFCACCLSDMESYPVKPGTVILLPNQTSEPKKAVRKKKLPPTPEEQMTSLKRRLVVYRITSAILAFAVCGLIYISARVITQLDLQRLLGQNYTSITDILDGDSSAD